MMRVACASNTVEGGRIGSARIIDRYRRRCGKVLPQNRFCSSFPQQPAKARHESQASVYRQRRFDTLALPPCLRQTLLEQTRLRTEMPRFRMPPACPGAFTTSQR